ncbi:unnamed protein product [marine sediment metagenome]|uniref:Uncharacterized protein n=1 Tax=marine sediment metagenome TaxID=412755 RepID=X1KAN5_9ZZZZ
MEYVEKEFETITPEQLIEKIEQISRGSGGVIIVPLSYWRNIQAAYEAPLIRIVAQESLQTHPQRSYPGCKLSFRVNVKANARKT